MKVLYLTWLDPATTDYPLFLSLAWKRMGHDVRLLPPGLAIDIRAFQSFRHSIANMEHNDDLRRRFMEKSVSTYCDSFRPDVLILGGSHITPDAMQRLRDRYGVMIGYIIGYNHILAGFAAAAIQQADFLVIHDSYLYPIVQGTRYGRCPYVFFLPSAAEPKEHHPVPLSDKDRRDYGADIGFIGGVSANRIAALQQLTAHDLRIWGGAGWEKADSLSGCYRREPVYGLKKTKIYNTSKIILNIEDDEKQIHAFSQRVPETLACGGFIITQWRKDLEQTQLIDGESIVTYRTLDELVEKVDFYLAHPAERNRISENGRRIVLDSMTYDSCAPLLIEQVEALLHDKSRTPPRIDRIAF